MSSESLLTSNHRLFATVNLWQTRLLNRLAAKEGILPGKLKNVSGNFLLRTRGDGFSPRVVGWKIARGDGRDGIHT